MVDCGDGAAVAQVAGDEAQVLEGATQEVRCLLGGIAVARAVGAVATDAVVVVVAHGQRVHVGLGRHGLVESRVEDGYLRSLGQQLAQQVDAGVGAGVVQRGELLAQGELGAGVVVDKGRLAEILAAGHDAVAHGVNGVEGFDGGAGAAYHHVQQLAQATRNREAFHRHGDFLKVGGERDVHEGLRCADLLGQALHERGLAVGLDELGLEGGTACVYDEYEHGKTSLCRG